MIGVCYNLSMNKILVIIVIITLLIAALVFYFYFFKEPAEEILPPVEKAANPAAAGTLPSIGSDVKVVVPELNPIEKANPYKDVYKNPFE